MNDSGSNMVAWVDQNFEEYIELGYDVSDPEMVFNNPPKYDYVLIANILEDTSKSIEKYLLGLGVL